ncbi:uncharacterized protein HGUI_02202 [Hanseniaspora guilliermondii]|uniref:Dolichyl-diphosphooligosaccharide--protein glycosyltransferase subunit OST6 n=1 Tax=Hanseniaspora guilliermondii TaxID=56406 RepID=A0A1L0B0R8_9ASCO|nr:uncharacterized protein HGUI_02202 [Hanseniaspora guilliermondii]
MILLSLLYTLICNLAILSSNVVVDKLPSFDINIDEIDNNYDIFFIEVNSNDVFNKWLNNTNYIATHYSLIYLFNSDHDNKFANVHDYVTTELKTFSKHMLETGYNRINRNCYITSSQEELENEYEYESINNAIKENGFFYIDNLLQCQENIKTLTFIVDLKNIELYDIEILSDSESRLIIFPPTITLNDYYKQKYQIQSSMFWDGDDINNEDTPSLLLEDEDFENNYGDDVIEEKPPSSTELFDKFMNECKFSLLGSRYVPEVVFFEYEDLHLEHIAYDFNDWRFKFWDYLAKTLVIYINMPSSIQEQTNVFLYYFVVFFAILLVLKKKVLPHLTRKTEDEETADANKGRQVLFMFILFSFMIIISSITGYQFVKLNSIVLLVRDDNTKDLVYFAGTFNWQFGIETAIISVVYIILMYMMLLILKKSREIDDDEELYKSDRKEVILNVVSMLLILYLLKVLSHDILTMKIFKQIKYNNEYAY